MCINLGSLKDLKGSLFGRFPDCIIIFPAGRCGVVAGSTGSKANSALIEVGIELRLSFSKCLFLSYLKTING